MGLFNHPNAQRAEKPDSTPIKGARRTIYNAGSDTLTPIFRDPHLTYSVANPSISDANGDFQDCYLLAGTYRVQITDRFENVLLDEDGVVVEDEVTTTTVTTVQGGGATSFASVDALVSDETLSYAGGGDAAAVSAGETLWVAAPGYGYEVAPETAADHILETVGGVKLYALPDQTGAVSTAQLGWTPDMDCTDALEWFFDHHRPDTEVLRFTSTYRIRGAGHVIPETLRAFVSDDYHRLSHGEHATRGLLVMDAAPESAAANGISYNVNALFRVPSDFMVGGLFFDHDRAVDADAIPNGGNKDGLFECRDKAVGPNIDKCRFQISGGKGIDLSNAAHWRLTNSFAGKQKYLMYLSGACDFGVFSGNRGRMGHAGNFGDYIKTNAVANRGPRYCTVRDNYFLNDVRDGPDGTGGFHGWTFERNVFDVPIAGIDIKKAFRTPVDLEQEEDLYRGIRVINNTFIGCGIVYTFTWVSDDMGEVPDVDDRGLSDVYCAGNIYRGRVGGTTVGHLLKGVQNVVSDGETFIPVRTASTAEQKPATGRSKSLPPVAVVEVPTHGPLKPFLDRHGRTPAEFFAQARRVDGITGVVTGPIAHEGHQITVRPVARCEPVENVADRADQLQVRPLVLAPDVVAAPEHTLFQYEEERVGVILDIEPVANIGSVAVDRDRLARERVQDDDRNELFREMVGAVIVGAIGQDHREAVGLMPRPHEMVGRGLRGRVWRAGIIGRRLGELALGAERAEHFVRRNMVKPEPFGPALPFPIGTRGFEQVEGAKHIRLDEGRGAVDGAVDMAFCGEVHDRIGSMRLQHPVERGAVADVDLFERISGRVRHVRHVVEAGGIGQRVEVDHIVPARNGQPDHRGPDEPGAAGDEQLHADTSKAKGLSISDRRGAAASLSDSTGSPSRAQSMAKAGSSNRTERSQSGAK